MDLQIEVTKIIDSINGLHSDISAQTWGTLNQSAFVSSLDKTIDALKGLEERFARTKTALDKESAVGKPDLSEILNEFKQLLPMLRNNLQMEKTKKSRAKESNIFETEENAEHYEDLAQKIQTILLKARYMAERLNVFALRQSSTPLEGKGTARQMLDLLQTKEKEIEELRGKYEDIRKRSYLGYVQEQTSVDIEQDLSELSMRMAANANELSKEISLHKNQLEFIENSYASLKQRLDSMQETFDNYVEKNIELISMLKKERDYAKKVVLDVEHETLQLRNTYTSEMLSLQENKLKAKKEAEDRFKKSIDVLKKEIKEKDSLLSTFRNIAGDKANKESKFEERIKQLTLLLKTKEKHSRIKARLKGKRKGSSKKK